MDKLKRILHLVFIALPECMLRAVVKYLPCELMGNKVRFWYYRRRFFALGGKTVINEGCEIFFPQLIQVGINCSIGRYSELNPGPSQATPCLIIGDNSWFGPYCFFRTANHKFDDPQTLFFLQGHEESKIVIGNGVYAGAHCIFLPGTEIGDHCVIAAGSVVSGKIPPYSIVAGNPARVVRKRL